MSKRFRGALLKYSTSALFVILTVWGFLALRDFENAALVDQYRMLCDAFTVPGLLLILFGALVWVSNAGALDGLAYCVRYAIFMLIPVRPGVREEKYGDYVERRSKNRVKGYGFLFWSGLVTMVIAFVFMGLYYSVY